MKGMDIFCASQASTAICLSMDQASCSSSNTIQLGGRAIDRHNPIITDSRRTTSSKTLTVPCSSQPPIAPKNYHDHKNAKKNSSTKPNDQTKKSAKKGHDQKKKITAEKQIENITNSYSSKPIHSVLRRSRLHSYADLITSPGSTRCLLSENALLDGLSDYDPISELTSRVENKKALVVHQDGTHPASQPFSSSHPKSGSSDQVVVLRVSLHCKGCEGKVRKHLSRMQGVTSFNIDFAAKKVTVVGDVTPLSVLASISKVKNAQFWLASAVGSGIADTKKMNLSN